MEAGSIEKTAAPKVSLFEDHKSVSTTAFHEGVSKELTLDFSEPARERGELEKAHGKWEGGERACEDLEEVEGVGGAEE